MNTPNKLTLLRVLMIPLFIAAMLLLPFPWSALVGAAIYGLASATDAIDGHLARKNNQVTDFGKFLDPLADKFLTFSAILVFVSSPIYYGSEALHVALVLSGAIVIFRELAVTSLRLVVAGSSGIVVAASIWGKLKTVSQMVGTVVILVEPLTAFIFGENNPAFFENDVLSYIFMGIMLVTTLFSGIDYLRAYLPHINTNK